MAPDGATESNTELIKLRAELKSVCQHRDELERDVENLCMQGSFSFSSSSVLSDRIRQAEREVAKMTSQVGQAQAAVRYYLCAARSRTVGQLCYRQCAQ